MIEVALVVLICTTNTHLVLLVDSKRELVFEQM